MRFFPGALIARAQSTGTWAGGRIGLYITQQIEHARSVEEGSDDDEIDAAGDSRPWPRRVCGLRARSPPSRVRLQSFPLRPVRPPPKSSSRQSLQRSRAPPFPRRIVKLAISAKSFANNPNRLFTFAFDAPKGRHGAGFGLLFFDLCRAREPALLDATAGRQHPVRSG